ncbi:hypothetical protein FRC19_011170 [Serendipita sp. 401]|nr:hypothetical protein FRC19_011170 [Serendipita sp. 401]
MYPSHQQQHNAADYFDQNRAAQVVGTPLAYGSVPGYPPPAQYTGDTLTQQMPYSGQNAMYDQDVRCRYPAPASPIHSSHPNGHFRPSHDGNAGEGMHYMVSPQGYSTSGQMAGTPEAGYAHSSTPYLREQGYAEVPAAYYHSTNANGIPTMSQQHLSANHPTRPGLMRLDTSPAAYQLVDSQTIPSPLSAPHSPLPGSSFSGQQAANAQQPRPHVCEVCGLGFARGHDLKRHKETHTNLKPHICDCGKSFSRKDALKRHIFLKSCGPGSSAAAGGYATSEE